MNLSRRMFLKTTGAAMMAGAFPLNLVKIAFGAPDPAQDFTFAYISDAHIQHIEGNKFVHNWDMGLIRAIREASSSVTVSWLVRAECLRSCWNPIRNDSRPVLN